MHWMRKKVLVLLILLGMTSIFSSLTATNHPHMNLATDTNNYKIIWIMKKAENFPNSLRWSLFPAYNDNDGVMAGLVLTNQNSTENRKFSFVLAPMYSFKTSKLLGQGKISYDFMKQEGRIDKFSYWLGVKSFDFNHNNKFDYSLRYIKLEPGVSVHLKPKDKKDNTSTITFKTAFISEDKALFNLNEFSAITQEYFIIPRLEYFYSMHDEYQGTDIRLSSEYQGYNNESYLKLTATGDQKYRYAENKFLFFRAFVSGFLINSQRYSSSFQNIFTRGSIALIYHGFNDYTYDETFLSRQNQTGFQNDQISLTSGGGFKTPVGSAYGIGMSNHFAASFGFSSDIPFRLPKWIPLRAYFDIGSYSIYSSVKFKNNIIYNGGLSLHYRDIGAIYIPLFFSDNLGSIYKSEHKSFFSRISFSINLNKIELGKLPSNVY